MRFLVLIPALALLLSNIPFIHEMPLEEEMAMVKEGKGCSMQIGVPVERSCVPGNSTENSGTKAKGCCNRTETTTTCICLFTFTAPVHEIKTFQFDAVHNISRRTGYLELKWNDPHIDSPGQPPDIC
jgi:hypothetical protein